MSPGATPVTSADSAREVAVRITEYFARTGWDAVADSIVGADGIPWVEVRSAEPLGVVPGRYAPHRARWPVRSGDVDREVSDLLALLATARVAPSSRPAFTTHPILPAWCRAD